MVYAFNQPAASSDFFFFFFLNVIVDEHQINDDGECKWRDHAHPEVTFKHVVEQPRLFSKKNNQ